MEPIPLSHEARARSWSVFALVLLSAAYFFQSTGHNEAARFDQVRSVAEHGEWWIDRFAYNTADVVRVDSHTYPGKAPGTTILGVIPWRLARAALSLLPLSDDESLLLATYFLTVLMSAVPTAATSLLLLRFLARNRSTLATSTLLALGYGLGTMAFPWATVFFGHQLATAFAFGGFYLVWKSRWSSEAEAWRQRLAGGLLLGFLPVIEHPGAIASVLILIYGIGVLGLRGSLPLFAFAFLGALPLPVFNLVVFGNPFSLGYGFYAKEGSTFPAHQAGLVGVSWPQWDVLKEITFKPQRGLFYANPWLCAIFLAPFFWRRFRGMGAEILLFTSIFSAFLLFNAGYGTSIVYWGGGHSFGPRHLLIALPFVAPLIALPMNSRVAGRLIGVLIVGNALLMLVVTAVEPRFPYEPKEPFRDFYLPFFARGLLSVNPDVTFGEGTILGMRGAFNLGQVLGLPRDLEILPLVLVWSFAAFRFIEVPTSLALARALRLAVVSCLILTGLVPAWRRLAPGPAEDAGLCQSVSGGRWPYFSSYGFPPEPSLDPQHKRVPRIAIAPGELAFETWPTLAVTFSGYFDPPHAGWYVLDVEAIGEAVVYVDGARRTEVLGKDAKPHTTTVQAFFSRTTHEIMVRYMSDQKERALNVTISLRDRSLAPLEGLLTTRSCPSF